MLRPLNSIVLMVFKMILKRPTFLKKKKWFTSYLSLPCGSIGLGVFYKVFRALFSTSRTLITTLGFLPVFQLLYSIIHLISRNLSINDLNILSPNLNVYVSTIIT